jgi:hypothetical protein
LHTFSAVSCILSSLALEKVIGCSDIETVYNKSTQILAYADGTVIVGRSVGNLEETEEYNGSSTGNGTCSGRAEGKTNGSNKKN